MIFFGLLAAVVTLAPLAPARAVDLSRYGSSASDVAWVSDGELLVALVKGGVVNVSLPTGRVTRWLPQAPPPQGVPFAQLVASDGRNVTVVGGGKNFVFRKSDGTPSGGYEGGILNPRGVAVTGSSTYYIGWVSRVATDEDQQRGVLWKQSAGSALSERPMHRIVSGSEALARWRLTPHPYGGSMVALEDGSIAVMTSAEPGLYRYDGKGKLVQVLGSGVESLVVDSPRLVKSYAADIPGRYRDILNRQPSIDDLVATPAGVAVLVRVAKGRTIGWQLWYLDQQSVTRIQPLQPAANGPLGHMKCEARRDWMACVTNMPAVEQADQPRLAGSNPKLLLYRLSR